VLNSELGAQPRQPWGLSLVRDILHWSEPEVQGLRGRFVRTLRRYLDWNRQLLLDPWLRYLPVVEILRHSLFRKSPRVLDVGSGAAGLAHFLRRPVTGVDLEFPRAELSRFLSALMPVRASATNLPFRDSSFDAVVSMDLLEHLPRSRRTTAVRELFRVARDLLIFGFPYGEKSAAFDSEALREERARGVRLGWREEHVRHGVPGDELHREVLAALSELRPEMRLTWFGQEGLLGLRLRWKLQFFVNKDSRLYGGIFGPLYWIHARSRPRKSYRRIYVATLPRPRLRSASDRKHPDVCVADGADQQGQFGFRSQENGQWSGRRTATQVSWW